VMIWKSDTFLRNINITNCWNTFVCYRTNLQKLCADLEQWHANSWSESKLLTMRAYSCFIFDRQATLSNGRPWSFRNPSYKQTDLVNHSMPDIRQTLLEYIFNFNRGPCSIAVCDFVWKAIADCSENSIASANVSMNSRSHSIVWKRASPHRNEWVFRITMEWRMSPP
jgi:hypothetical protein